MNAISTLQKAKSAIHTSGPRTDKTTEAEAKAAAILHVGQFLLGSMGREEFDHIVGHAMTRNTPFTRTYLATIESLAGAFKPSRADLRKAIAALTVEVSA